MRISIFLFLLLVGGLNLAISQDVPVEGDSSPDLRYREDQIYLGLTYNLILDKPDGFSQSNFSYGLNVGVIRDMPINRDRTLALGIGLGYAVNSYYSNLWADSNAAMATAETPAYTFIRNRSFYNRNKLEMHLIEVPLEIRWRNSTPDTFKFWRIYGGVKFGYAFANRSKIITDDFRDTFYNQQVERFRYGLTLNVGYNTFNLHAYYGLNALFQDGTQTSDGTSLEMAPLRLGLTFYIL
nr:porin family protein [Robiginitalea myxolifaciens]